MPLRHGQFWVHSKPHSKGRTTRLLSTDVSRVSQPYIHRSYQEPISLKYSKDGVWLVLPLPSSWPGTKIVRLAVPPFALNLGGSHGSCNFAGWYRPARE